MVGLMWLMQVVFLPGIYEAIRLRQINTFSREIESVLSEENRDEKIKTIADENDVCVMLVSSNGQILYSAEALQNCMIHKISYISIISYYILLIFSVSSVLLMFPFIESIEQIPALYLVARYIEFGRFFQRIDAVFLLIWIISIISYLSFAFSLINNIFKELVNITNENMLIGSFGLITFGVSLIPKNLVQIRFLENTVYKYSAIFMVFIFSFIILLFAYIKKSKEQLKNKESENIDEEIL